VNKVKRVRITAYIHKELVDWLDMKVEEGRFRSRSHGVEESIQTKRMVMKGEILEK